MNPTEKMRYLLASVFLTSSLFASNIHFDFGPTYGFRYDQYSVTDSTSTNRDKIKYLGLYAVTTGGSMCLTAEKSLYFGVRGSYGVVIDHPKATIFHNGSPTDENIRLDKKYTIDADGVMGYQFHLSHGNVLCCPQIGYGYSKYKLTGQCVAPSIQATSLGAFAVVNGAPYAGLKTIWLLRSGMSFHMTLDYFYVAFRHETPVLDANSVRTTFRMSTLQGPRCELKFETEFRSGWFMNATARARYLFSPEQKALLLHANSPESLKSNWLTLESLFAFGYSF